MANTTASNSYEAAIIGSGFAGLCMAIKLREAGIDDIVIFEKADDLGGTWRDNTYPGSACDVKAMLYSYSFEQSADWSREHPQQPEILAYMQRTADKYDVRRHIRFNTEVDKASFDADKGEWAITTKDSGGKSTSHHARILVSGTGQLNRPAFPRINGIDTFKGKSFHSARWDHDYDLRGKRVAVVGNGASAIQFIPEIAPQVQHLYIFQRNANWMKPRNDRAYNFLEKTLFKAFPVLPRLLRLQIYLSNESYWPAVFTFGDLGPRKLLEGLFLWNMRRQIKDPALQEKLTPKFPAGCNRVLISDDYYPTLNRSNVDVIDDPIVEIREGGVVTKDGIERAVDCIIYATGFASTEFLAPMEITGLHGVSLEERWRDGAEAYLGVTVPHFPNLYILYGPNTNLGHNSIIFMIEHQVAYAMQCIDKIRRENLRYLDVRETVMQDWNAECQGILQDSVWAQGCNSWYKTKSGKITNNWPYSTLVYQQRMQEVDFADYQAVKMHPSIQMTGEASHSPSPRDHVRP